MKKASPKKVPALYPPPPPIELNQDEIEHFDLKKNVLILKPSARPKIDYAISIERHRIDLNARIKEALESSLYVLAPHWGDRPKHIPMKKWNNLEDRIRLATEAELSSRAPAECYDALIAAKTIHRIVDLLVKVDDWPDEMDIALCLAVDVGMLLQRIKIQVDFGKHVDAGNKNSVAREKAINAKRAKTQSDCDEARDLYNKIKGSESRILKDSVIFNRMLRVKDENGEPKFGSVATLKRYKKEWNSITPPK